MRLKIQLKHPPPKKKNLLLPLPAPKDLIDFNKLLNLPQPPLTLLLIFRFQNLDLPIITLHNNNYSIAQILMTCTRVASTNDPGIADIVYIQNNLTNLPDVNIFYDAFIKPIRKNDPLYFPGKYNHYPYNENRYH
jgi:hypothetical protein